MIPESKLHLAVRHNLSTAAAEPLKPYSAYLPLAADPDIACIMKWLNEVERWLKASEIVAKSKLRTAT